MRPSQDLPIPPPWHSVPPYIDSLLNFTSTHPLFQTLCGGIHILDFFTSNTSLFHTILPSEWLPFLTSIPIMDFLDLLLRDDLNSEEHIREVPQSLLAYIRDIRAHSLDRSCRLREGKAIRGGRKHLPRHIAVGMNPKKIHEVQAFAEYVDQFAQDVALSGGDSITHFVDFGAGQNYLGRALASPPYNRHIVAVESREGNVQGARGKDVGAGLAEREVVRRNKKLFKGLNVKGFADKTGKGGAMIEEHVNGNGITAELSQSPVIPLAEDLADLRPIRDLATTYTSGEGRGSIQYISAMLNDGDLSTVISEITKPKLLVVDDTLAGKEDTVHSTIDSTSTTEPSIMAISIHSCGNLSHYGITSLLLNPSVKSIAIVGCCYNLLTEKLGAPTTKHPSLVLRQPLTPINSNPNADKSFQPREQSCDPHGYPMSDRVSTYPNPITGHGIRLNITARMMAVQAPHNWTEKESDSFFTRHYYRALLQKIFFDYGVVCKPGTTNDHDTTTGTEPIIIGSLPKSCYTSFVSYVRAAIEKISSHPDRNTERISLLKDITDEQIRAYQGSDGMRKKELSVMWSLMAFSAGVVESLIVVDRYLWLKEQGDLVRDAWVESVFEYAKSPRNLVVVGVKA